MNYIKNMSIAFKYYKEKLDTIFIKVKITKNYKIKKIGTKNKNFIIFLKLLIIIWQTTKNF